jgi:methyl-accepting chemotaxis protein
VILRSLRFKLSLSQGLVVALIFVFIGLVRYQTVSYRAQRNFDQTLLREGGRFASRIHLDGERISWLPLEDNSSPDLALEQLRPFFVITHEDGRIVKDALASDFMKDLISQDYFQRVLRQQSGFENIVAPDGTPFRFISLPLPSSPENARFILHVGRSMRSVDAVLNEYFIIWLAFVPIILVASVGVAWIIAGRALRPFEKVAQTAQQITTENLNTRIVAERNEREIQRLVEAFNVMAARLESSFQQMRRFNADVAHELRTPLSILKGETEIALRSQSLNQ